MKTNFLAAFTAMKDYLYSTVPELGNIITRIDDPFVVKKNQTIMLPDSHASEGNSLTFDIRLYISTVEKNADAIALAQIDLMEKLYSSISGDIPNVIRAEIQSADYFDPTPQSPNVGLLAVIISMTTNYIDDCGES